MMKYMPHALQTWKFMFWWCLLYVVEIERGDYIQHTITICLFYKHCMKDILQTCKFHPHVFCIFVARPSCIVSTVNILLLYVQHNHPSSSQQHTKTLQNHGLQSLWWCTIRGVDVQDQLCSCHYVQQCNHKWWH